MTSAARDPATGDLIYKLSINVDVTGRLPLFIDCADWKAAARYLTSAEFRHIAAKVNLVTIHNRESSP